MRTVEKALMLLQHFDEHNCEFSLTRLAELSGYDKATTLRMLRALAKFDFVERNAATKAYRLGPGVLHLARVREASTPLLEVTMPLLQDLHERSGLETAHLALLSGGRLTTQGVIEGQYANRISFAIGEASTLHASATGIVTLAHLPEAELAKLLPKQLPSLTEHTPTSQAELMKLFVQSKSAGYYINKELNELGCCSVASPLIDHTGWAIGAYAIALPLLRMTPAKQDACVAAVIDIARQASILLGAQFVETPVAVKL